MVFDPKYALNVLLKLCVASYVLDVSTMELPSGWRMVAPIVPSDSFVKLYTASPSEKESKLFTIMRKYSNTFGYVFASDEQVIVAFRGTKDIDDWIHDFDFQLTEYPYGAPEEKWGEVHSGALGILSSAYTSILDSLAPFGQIENLLVTGHSLGAQIAVLATPALKIATTDRPQMVNFAGPRAGDPDFAKMWDTSFEGFRIVNLPSDIVPEVPPPILYEHVAMEIVVHGGIADPKTAHNLTEGYEKGLEKLCD